MNPTYPFNSGKSPFFDMALANVVEFESYYESTKKSEGYEKEEFLNECEERKKQAIKDKATWKRLNREPLEIAKKIAELVLKAESKGFAEIDHYQVTGLFARMQEESDPCLLCSYKVKGPPATPIQIKNLINGETLSFNYWNIHLLLAHAYCGRKANSRIDPDKASEVITK